MWVVGKKNSVGVMTTLRIAIIRKNVVEVFKPSMRGLLEPI